MDDQKLQEYVDQQRWLLNNGLVSDGVKNQLFFCGSIVHKEVQAVELNLDTVNKIVNYKIYIDKSLIDKIEKYKELSIATTVFGMWKFKRLLKREGSLDFQKVLGKLVSGFCGSKWTTTVEVVDFAKYVETGDDSGNPPDNQLLDQLLNK